MEGDWIQVRLLRGTRERLREYARRISRSKGLSPANRANQEPSPEQAVSLLLDQWEGRTAKQKEKRKKD